MYILSRINSNIYYIPHRMIYFDFFYSIYSCLRNLLVVLRTLFVSSTSAAHWNLFLKHVFYKSVSYTFK